MRMVDARASTTLTPNHHFQTMFRDLILDRIFVLNYFRPKFQSKKIKLGPNSGSGGLELRANWMVDALASTIRMTGRVQCTAMYGIVA